MNDAYSRSVAMLIKALLLLYVALFAVSLFLDHGPRTLLH